MKNLHSCATRRMTIFCAFFFAVCTTTFAAHPPSDSKTADLTPTKAGPDLEQARLLMDIAKSKLAAQGRNSCCIKPLEKSKVSGCDLCIARNGSCKCRENLAAGKGVCGQCLGGWKAGQGALPGIQKETVKLLASPAQAVEGSPIAPPELEQARAVMIRAKKTLVAEKRFACCVGKGGCDECAHEQNCPCGGEVAKGAAGTGVCGTCLDGWNSGIGLFDGIAIAEVKLAPPMEMEHGSMPGGTMMAHEGHMMSGMTGSWSMTREASGTSWLPDSSPMYGKMSQMGAYQTMFHGSAFGVYTDQGGQRGGDKFFAPTMAMGMGWRQFGDGSILGGKVMLSTDPFTIGTGGYPLLFQTGETAHGKPLVDAQHPHDLFMELAATYSRPLSRSKNAPRGILYLAPVGEPALGPPTFMHRPSGMENPEAPLSHHWLDSTHITYGVATAGIASNAVKVEGSIFTGREPDENRYGWDKMRLDSYAGRLSINPSRQFSAQISHGFLKSPEDKEPFANEQRTTASVIYNLPYKKGQSNLQTTVAWGRKRLYELGVDKRTTDAYLLESSYLAPRYTVFGRYERVGKDELFPELIDHTDTYTINKFTLGGIVGVGKVKGSDLGVGSSISTYSFPSALRGSYGTSPVSFNVFVRLRTTRMM